MQTHHKNFQFIIHSFTRPKLTHLRRSRVARLHREYRISMSNFLQATETETAARSRYLAGEHRQKPSTCLSNLLNQTHFRTDNNNGGGGGGAVFSRANFSRRRRRGESETSPRSALCLFWFFDYWKSGAKQNAFWHLLRIGWHDLRPREEPDLIN